MEKIQGSENKITIIQYDSTTGFYRKGQVAYDREQDMIIFYWDDESDVSRYYVRLSKIQTYEEQILFLDHIAGKGFLTEKVLKEFFECLKIAGLMPKRSPFPRAL
jgi:hypothetical protein